MVMRPGSNSIPEQAVQHPGGLLIRAQALRLHIGRRLVIDGFRHREQLLCAP